MALIYFYEATDIDKEQLSERLKPTDHHWEYVDKVVSQDNINPDTEVLSVFVGSVVTKEIIDSLPKLRIIACRSTGFNNIDVKAAESKGVSVLNVPSYGDATVAEFAFTLILALSKNLTESIEQGQEQHIDHSKITGIELKDKTLGVIGVGKIGRRAIQIAKGLSMNVIGYDAYPNEEYSKELDFEYKQLDELLETSDIVTIHTPYTPKTHHLLDGDRIAKMKKGAILVNTARGEIVDTLALVNALRAEHLGAAGLDVLENEKLLDSNEGYALLEKEVTDEKSLQHSLALSLLKEMPNVIVTPHNAFNTVEAIQRINNTTVDNIISYWSGDIPNKVTAPQRTVGNLIIVRHAESEWNATGKWSGTSDVHLSANGFREAALFGKEVRKLKLIVDVAYCSEQIRSRETLEGILNASQQFDVDVNTRKEINERSYGIYTGRNKWEVKEEFGEEAFEAIRRGWDVEVPDGETLKMVYERAVPFYKNEVIPQLREGKNVLIVAHGNSLRALMKYIESISDEEIGRLEMLFGEIVVYKTDKDGKMEDRHIYKIDVIPPNA